MVLDRYMKRSFSWYAPYLVRFWPVALAIPLVVSTVLGLGFLRKEELRLLDARLLYTPSDAPSWTEEKILDELWPLNPYEFLPGRSYNYKRYVMVILTAREFCGDKLCNLMNQTYMEEMLTLDDLMANNVSVLNVDRGVAFAQENNLSPVTYSDLCLGWYPDCYRTGGGTGPLSLLANKEQLEDIGIVVSYPRANEGGTPIYLAHTAGGVVTNPVDNSIEYVAAIKLVYFLRGDNETLDSLSQQWELSAEKFINEEYRSDLISAKLFQSRSIDLGLQRNSIAIRPKIVMTVIVLILFSTFTMLKWTRSQDCALGYRLDLLRSKPWLAIGGVLTAGLGIASGMGAMMLLGYHYVEINDIVPFLVLSIGVDDMFIMVSAWHNAKPMTSPGGGDVTLSPLSRRMQTTLSDAAVAITITSVTDALSFAVGSYTTILSMHIFCLNAAVSVCFNWIYQVTFFGALLVVGGIAEHAGRNALVPCLKARRGDGDDDSQPPGTENGHLADGNDQQQKEELSITSGAGSDALRDRADAITFNSNRLSILRIEIANGADHIWPGQLPSAPRKDPTMNGSGKEAPFGNGSSVSPTEDSHHISEQNGHIRKSSKGQRQNRTHDQSLSTRFFRHYYGPMLLHWASRLVVLLAFVVYLSVAVWGMCNVRVGLKYERLLLKSDPVTKYIETENKYLQAGAQVEVVFSKPPNLTTQGERNEVSEIVEAFENSHLATGKPGTQFWLREYMNYLNNTGSYIADTRQMWVTGVYDWVNELYSFYILWSQDIAWKGSRDNDTLEFKAFRFRIGLERFHDSKDIVSITAGLRELCARYAHYNLSTYQHYRQLADQISNTVPNTLRNVVIAVVCMTIVALVMLPNPVCTLWIVMAIVSIDVGVVGYMTWWGLNLDAISMITIIMSIGFSVDFAAHITYGFTTSTEPDVQGRVIDAIEKLAFPVFEGALSTVLGTSVLAFVDSYMVVVFWKTIFLVVCFGALHALVFIPVLIATAMPTIERILRRPKTIKPANEVLRICDAREEHKSPAPEA